MGRVLQMGIKSKLDLASLYLESLDVMTGYMYYY
jgi:hypothetical protein